MAKANRGPVERANNHCQPKVGITTKARATSKHAPKAQKHCKIKIHTNHCNLIVYDNSEYLLLYFNIEKLNL